MLTAPAHPVGPLHRRPRTAQPARQRSSLVSSTPPASLLFTAATTLLLLFLTVPTPATAPAPPDDGGASYTELFSASEANSRPRLRRTPANSFPDNAKPPTLASLPQNQVVVEVCDAQNNPHNYFIYCSGKLLEAVMEYHLFNDSKTWVDMPLKYDARDVEKKFEKQFPMAVSEINDTKLRDFVNENFLPEGTELLKWVGCDGWMGLGGEGDLNWVVEGFLKF